MSEIDDVAQETVVLVEDALEDLDSGESNVSVASRSFFDRAFVTITISEE